MPLARQQQPMIDRARASRRRTARARHSHCRGCRRSASSASETLPSRLAITPATMRCGNATPPARTHFCESLDHSAPRDGRASTAPASSTRQQRQCPDAKYATGSNRDSNRGAGSPVVRAGTGRWRRKAMDRVPRSRVCGSSRSTGTSARIIAIWCAGSWARPARITDADHEQHQPRRDRPAQHPRRRLQLGSSETSLRLRTLSQISSGNSSRAGCSAPTVW